MNRTISSARAFLAGLYSSKKRNNQIQADGNKQNKKIFKIT